MGLADIFQKKQKIILTEKDLLLEFIASLELQNIPDIKLEYKDSDELNQSGSRSNKNETIFGPFKSQYTDGKIIIPAINDCAMCAFIGALDWIYSDKSTRSFNNWFEDNICFFIDDICKCNQLCVKSVSDKLLDVNNELACQVINVCMPTKVEAMEHLYDFFYICLAVDLIRGRVYDTFKVCSDIYDIRNCREIVNSFPIRENTKSSDSTALNLAVAYWISYNAIYSKSNDFNRIKSFMYNKLVEYLGYSGIRYYDKYEAATFACLDKRLFDIENYLEVRDMCSTNKEINYFLNLLSYIEMNDVYKSDFSKQIHGTTQLRIVLTSENYCVK